VVQVGVVDVRGRGTWRADLGASSRLATYRGRIQADDGAQALPLARYEQVELRGGALDGSAAPLRYHGDDPWDREELGDALAADRLAEQLSTSFAADHGDELRPAGFYADFVDAEAPVLDRLEDLAPRRRGALVGPPAPVLVAVVVTDALVVEGGFLPGPAVSRVAELRRGGASWGLLLVRHDLGPAALRAAADRALDQAADAGARRGAEIGGSGSAGSRRGRFVRRRLGTVVVLGLLLVLFSANRIAVLVTDFWWFDERGFRQVFTTVLGTRILLGVGVRAGPRGADRGQPAHRAPVRPFYVPSSPQQAQIQRYREMADPYLPWLIAGSRSSSGSPPGWRSAPAGRPSCCSATAARSGHRRPAVRRRHRLLPVRAAVLDAGADVAVHLAGADRAADRRRALPARRHPARRPRARRSCRRSRPTSRSCWRAILAVRAWGYWLDRYELLYSERGTVTGASYTDVNAELPALYLLIGVSVIAIVLVLASIRRAGSCCRVRPSGCSSSRRSSCRAPTRPRSSGCGSTRRSSPASRSSSRNLEATRPPTGSTTSSFVPFEIANDLDEDDVIDNDITLRNVRLWDPNVLETTYQQLQALRPYYEFNNVAIDRYEIDGELRQVMLATRELSQLPERPRTPGRTATSPSPTGSGSSPRRSTPPTPRASRSSSPPTSRRRADDEVVPDEEPGVYFGEFADPIYSWSAPRPDELNFEDPRPRSRSHRVRRQRRGPDQLDSGGGSPSRCGSTTTTWC
jgi:hypothetical protein